MALNRLLIVLGIAAGLVACDSANKAKSTLESVSTSLTESAIFDAEGMLWLDALQRPVGMIRDGESLLIVPTNLDDDQFGFVSIRQSGDEDPANHSTPVTVTRVLSYFGDTDLSNLFESCTNLMTSLESGGDPQWLGPLVYMTGGGDWYVESKYEELKKFWAKEIAGKISACTSRTQKPDPSTPMIFRNISQNPDQEIIPALIADDGSSVQHSFIRKLTDAEKKDLLSKTKEFLEERRKVREKFRDVAATFSYEAQIERAGLAEAQPGQALVVIEGENRFRVVEEGE